MERAARRESGPADWRVERVVSKKLAPDVELYAAARRDWIGNLGSH